MSRRGAVLAWPALAGASSELLPLFRGTAAAASGLSRAQALVGLPPSGACTPSTPSSSAWDSQEASTAPPQQDAALAARSEPADNAALLSSPRAARCSRPTAAAGLAALWAQHRQQHRHMPAPTFATQHSTTRALSTSPCLHDTAAGPGPSAGSGAAGGGAEGGGGAGGEVRMSLGDALNRLVDAAVERVEAGAMGEAVALLKDGLNTFEPLFPNSPELGELHNQVALLLLFENKAEEAAHHAQVSLEATRRHFGAGGLLTAHRLLRLGVARFAQGKVADAAGTLREAYELLGGQQGGGGARQQGGVPPDPGSAAEAGFYLDCCALAHTKEASGVADVTPSLLGHVRALKEAYGADSMILSLALAQYGRLVNSALEQLSFDFMVCEALLKQHLALLTAVGGPDSEDVAVARYKLATYYYSNDMLQDAGALVRQAATAMRAHYPEDHDMIVLCKHRLGMICAAAGDHRSAVQLLGDSKKHFGAEGGQAMLAKEADIGLAMAKFRAVDTVKETSAQRAQLQGEALEVLRKEIESLAESIGHGHMLVQGATKYYGQLCKLVR